MNNKLQKCNINPLFITISLLIPLYSFWGYIKIIKLGERQLADKSDTNNEQIMKNLLKKFNYLGILWATMLLTWMLFGYNIIIIIIGSSFIGFFWSIFHILYRISIEYYSFSLDAAIRTSFCLLIVYLAIKIIN